MSGRAKYSLFSETKKLVASKFLYWKGNTSMKAGNSENENIRKWTRRLAAPLLALVLVGSVVTYECIKPSPASAAAVPAPTPAAAPLDASSVSALTALDKAMETLTAW